MRVDNEIVHGRYLAAGDTEEIWGWGTPAGLLRADRRAELIMKGAALGPGQKAVEIGCGTGLFTEHFASCGATIIAVDLSLELLAIARNRHLPPTVQFVEKNFEDCEVDGPFDAVIGSSVLHHLDQGRAFAKIFRLLKPGGRLSFAEPNMRNPQIWMERHFRQFFPQVSPDETAFVRSKLRKNLQSHGFVSVEIEPFDWLHPATPAGMIPLVQWIGKGLESTWPLSAFAGSLIIHARKPA